jgi:hypothetical protein
MQGLVGTCDVILHSGNNVVVVGGSSEKKMESGSRGHSKC